MKKILIKTAKVIGIILGSIIGFVALLCIITLLWGAAQMSKGNEVYSDNFVAPYYIVDDENTQGFTVSKDVLAKGNTYTLIVTAESAYRLCSDPAVMTFSVN